MVRLSARRVRRPAALVAAVGAIALLASACGSASGAASDGGDYPKRAITFVVPYAAGGSLDIIAREFTKDLSEELHTTVTVQNQDGAQGTVGTGAVVTAKPDGYTIGMTTGNVLAFQTTQIKGLPWSSTADYTPIGKMASESSMLAVLSSSPYKTLADLIAAAKAQPDKIQVALAGIGSPQDLAIRQLNQETGAQMQTVAFSGGGAESLTALLGGRTTAVAGQSAYLKGQVEAGKVRTLTVLGQEPNPAMPDVPTLKDANLQGGIASDFYFIGPKGLPKAITDKLEAASEKVVNSDSYKKFASAHGYNVSSESAADTKKDLDDQASTYKDLAALIKK
jgi:tripartite-type tricarboxylate transporter receptor subunit TctC